MSIADIATTESRAKGGRQKGANVDTTRRRAHAVDLIVAGMDADDIPPAAYRTALQLVARVEAEVLSVPIESALDLVRVAQSADIVFRIARLASGQSTSNVAHANMTDDERRERMAQLRAMGSSDVVATATNEQGPLPTE